MEQGSSEVAATEQLILRNFDEAGAMWRDFLLIVTISAGIFVNKSSLVRRYVTFEKSQV